MNKSNRVGSQASPTQAVSRFALNETAALAGTLAGAGLAGTGLALGIVWMFQAWLLEFLRIQVTVAGLGRF